jgi:hypothetical protein
MRRIPTIVQISPDRGTTLPFSWMFWCLPLPHRTHPRNPGPRGVVPVKSVRPLSFVVGMEGGVASQGADAGKQSVVLELVGDASHPESRSGNNRAPLDVTGAWTSVSW